MGYVSIEFGDSQFVNLQEENILNLSKINRDRTLYLD